MRKQKAMIKENGGHHEESHSGHARDVVRTGTRQDCRAVPERVADSESPAKARAGQSPMDRDGLVPDGTHEGRRSALLLDPGPQLLPFTAGGYVPAMGRSSVTITCPVCGTDVVAFVWSLAGSGKRCPGCQCVHSHYGGTWRPTKPGKSRDAWDAAYARFLHEADDGE